MTVDSKTYSLRKNFFFLLAVADHCTQTVMMHGSNNRRRKEHKMSAWTRCSIDLAHVVLVSQVLLLKIVLTCRDSDRKGLDVLL